MKVLDDLASRANQYLRDREKTNDGPARGGREADPPMLALEKLPAPSRGYRLTSPAHLVFWLNDDVQPTVLVGKSHVALAINPERAAEALAPEQDGRDRWRPTGELIKAFECLPNKLTLLSVGDSRDSVVPALIASLPRYVQLLSDGLGDLEQADAGTPADILAMVGVPRPGAFRVRISAGHFPKAERTSRPTSSPACSRPPWTGRGSASSFGKRSRWRAPGIGPTSSQASNGPAVRG